MNNLLVKNLNSSHLIPPLPTDKARQLADDLLNNLSTYACLSAVYCVS